MISEKEANNNNSINIGPRKQHYFFSNVLLPELFHADPIQMLTILQSNYGKSYLHEIWNEVGKMFELNERNDSTEINVEIKTFNLNSNLCLITLPEPKFQPEAYFIALVGQNENENVAHYYTLELSNDKPVICEWKNNSVHLNLDIRIEPDKVLFISEVMKVLR